MDFAQEAKRADKLRDHFTQSASTPMRPKEVQQELRANYPFVVAELQQARQGVRRTDGVTIAGISATLSDIISVRYGFQDTVDSTGMVETYAFEKYLKSMGVLINDYSLNDMAQMFGARSLNKSTVDQMLIEHGNFSGGAPRATTDINDDFRFLLPEVILEAVRTNYRHVAMHTNWLASTRNISRMKVTMPRIESSRAMPARVFEGSNVPFGSVKYGQKEVEVFKTGIALELTDELIMQTTISDLVIFLQEVGSNSAIAGDTEALRILTDGEQSDGTESSPVIGVDDPSEGISQKDLTRVRSRMGRLGMRPNVLISSEEQAIKNLVESGTTGEYLTMADFLNRNQSQGGVRDYVQSLPDNKIILINNQRCMSKLQFGAMRVEQDRDIFTQTNATVVTDYIGFAKIKRDACVGIQGDIPYNPTAGQPGGFPTYMDIDTLLRQTYEAVA